MTDIGTFTSDIRGFLSPTLDRFGTINQKAQDNAQQASLGGYIQAQLPSPSDRLAQVGASAPGGIGPNWQAGGGQSGNATIDWLFQHGAPFTNPWAPKESPTKPTGRGGNAGSTSSATYTGLEPNVAKWAGQVNSTFGDLGSFMPAAMLAIITNESHGDPAAHNIAGDAWGLFQQLHLNSNDPNTQFTAARQLAQEKLAAVNAAYAKNGINPDERTRALDFAAAWAGHFDYASGKFDPNSYDPGVNQTGQQWADVFLKNYDTVVKGRQQGNGAVGSPGAGGSTGGLGGVTPGAGGKIMQEFGVTDTSNGYLAAGNHVYDYGSAYGMAGGGHPGVDWAVPRGTQVATPLGGTVSVVGNDHGTGYFYQDTGNGDRDHSGEFAITLSNGDILILGHLSRINVNVGDQVNAGALIGASGASDGEHVHVEYRRKNQDGSYTVIDPRTVLGR